MNQIQHGGWAHGGGSSPNSDLEYMEVADPESGLEPELPPPPHVPCQSCCHHKPAGQKEWFCRADPPCKLPLNKTIKYYFSTESLASFSVQNGCCSVTDVSVRPMSYLLLNWKRHQHRSKQQIYVPPTPISFLPPYPKTFKSHTHLILNTHSTKFLQKGGQTFT